MKPGPALVALGMCALSALTAAPTLSAGAPRPAPIKAAYFYSYMSQGHLDSLAAAGFNRAIIKCISDSLGTRGAAEIKSFMERGRELGIEIAPEWSLQARARLNALPTSRRYTWDDGHVEADVGCPLDSPFWCSALLDRASEVLAAVPAARRLVVDLEIYTGSRHHYDAGPCRCSTCLGEFARSGRGGNPGDSSALEAFEEDRLTHILAVLLGEFAKEHPGIELGVFDLDFDSFVHRAMARALVQANVPTVDYTERTYSRGGAEIAAARAALGPRVPLIVGLYLKRFTPGALADSVQSVVRRADGYFIFSTYSLWQDPKRLAGAYTLAGPPSQYWTALRRANGVR